MLVKKSLLLKTLTGHIDHQKPIWFLRQAGRYLPLYREFSKAIPDFWDRCFSPDISSEITTFPIQEFDLDAVIFFSDILTIPRALGQKIEFSSDGICIESRDVKKILETYDVNLFHKFMFPVYQGITYTRLKIPESMPIIGFSGGAWTLITYMLGGQAQDRIATTLDFALKNDQVFGEMISMVNEVIAQHLINQISSGCNAIQIFDSWAGSVPVNKIDEWLLHSWQMIFDKVHKVFPEIPIILYPRSYQGSAEDFLSLRHLTAVSLSEDMDVKSYVCKLSPKIVLQGGLSPDILKAGGDLLKQSIKMLLDEVKDVPYVFNLGHGVLPQTPLENVRTTIELVRSPC